MNQFDEGADAPIKYELTQEYAKILIADAEKNSSEVENLRKVNKNLTQRLNEKLSSYSTLMDVFLLTRAELQRYRDGDPAPFKVEDYTLRRQKEENGVLIGKWKEAQSRANSLERDLSYAKNSRDSLEKQLRELKSKEPEVVLTGQFRAERNKLASRLMFERKMSASDAMEEAQQFVILAHHLGHAPDDSITPSQEGGRRQCRVVNQQRAVAAVYLDGDTRTEIRTIPPPPARPPAPAYPAEDDFDDSDPFAGD